MHLRLGPSYQAHRLLQSSTSSFVCSSSDVSALKSCFLDTTVFIYEHAESYVLVILFECLPDWDCSLFAVECFWCGVTITVLSLASFQLFLGFFLETFQIRPFSSSVITSNYTKARLLASWHQCPSKPQTAILQSLLSLVRCLSSLCHVLSSKLICMCCLLRETTVLRTRRTVMIMEGNPPAVTKSCCSPPWKGLLCEPYFAKSKVTGPC